MGERLPRRAWSESNHRELCAWLDRHGQAGSSAPARAAVFDWDDTCIFRCGGTATFRHQLDALRIRLDPDQVSAMVPEAVGAVTRLVAGPELADVRRAVLAAYEALWPDIERGEGERARAEHPVEHRTFRALIGWLYGVYEHTPGIGAPFAYPWMARWLAGHEPDEIEALAIEACELAAAEPIGSVAWQCEALGASEPVRFDILTGFKVVPEMRELMAAARAVGVRPHVVTASHEHVARGLVRHLRYDVDPDHVLGIRLETATDGRALPRAISKADHPLTHGAGKSEMVRARVAGVPVLVCGDTDGDYEMLTEFPETELRLVIDRGRGGRIAELYRDALGTAPLGLSGRTLLQARDETLGGFHPLPRER